MTTKHRLLAGLALLGSLLVFAPPAAAQEPGRITGQVTDAQSGQPLGEVQVFIPGSGIGTLTRANGRFIILNVTPGTHTLRAERIGMSAANQQVTVVAGQAVDVNFQMTTQALGLDEIVVTGTAGAARRREIGNTIAQVRIADAPKQTTDLSDMLRGAAPGLNISSSAGDMGQAQAIRADLIGPGGNLEHDEAPVLARQRPQAGSGNEHLDLAHRRARLARGDPAADPAVLLGSDRADPEEEQPGAQRYSPHS